MKFALFSALMVVATLAFGAGETLERYALVAGSNDGGKGTALLKYASSDAKNFRDVLTRLGGLKDDNSLLLINPERETLVQGLGLLSSKIKKNRLAGRQVQFVFYYSGHSDERGLLLGGERLEYSALKAELERTGAEVQIVVLDSCASGAFTRTKGGQIVAPFLSDVSTKVEGHAFLTSSTAGELSQESDSIESSFFTHALVAGLRGAADANGDSKVTLNEAYEYAYAQTTASTEATKAGTQHPAFDIQLNGKGNLVVTDVTSGGATLVFPKAMKGRITVRDVGNHLIADVQKTEAQELALGVDKGYYKVSWDEAGKLNETVAVVEEARAYRFQTAEFQTTTKTKTATRGWDETTPEGPGLRLQQTLGLTSLMPGTWLADLVPTTTASFGWTGFYGYLSAQTRLNYHADNSVLPPWTLGAGVGTGWSIFVPNWILNVDAGTAFVQRNPGLQPLTRWNVRNFFVPQVRTFTTLELWNHLGLVAGWEHSIYTFYYHQGFETHNGLVLQTDVGRFLLDTRFFLGVQL